MRGTRPKRLLQSQRCSFPPMHRATRIVTAITKRSYTQSAASARRTMSAAAAPAAAAAASSAQGTATSFNPAQRLAKFTAPTVWHEFTRQRTKHTADHSAMRHRPRSAALALDAAVSTCKLAWMRRLIQCANCRIVRVFVLSAGHEVAGCQPRSDTRVTHRCSDVTARALATRTHTLTRLCFLPSVPCSLCFQAKVSPVGPLLHSCSRPQPPL